jgi:hypothetical protein
MTELDTAIAAAFKSEGKQEEVNRVYLLLLKSSLFIPIEKDYQSTEEEPFRPLFAQIDNQFFMLAFDTLERLQTWAGNHYNDLGYIELSGRDVIAGISDQAFLGLNYGSDFYKEFSPEEVKRLKAIVSRLDQLKNK